MQGFQQLLCTNNFLMFVYLTTEPPNCCCHCCVTTQLRGNTDSCVTSYTCVTHVTQLMCNQIHTSWQYFFVFIFHTAFLLLYAFISYCLFLSADKYLAMAPKDKRKFYGKRGYVTLDQIDTWPDYYADNEKSLRKVRPDGAWICIT